MLRFAPLRTRILLALSSAGVAAWSSTTACSPVAKGNGSMTAASTSGSGGAGAGGHSTTTTSTSGSGGASVGGTGGTGGVCSLGGGGVAGGGVPVEMMCFTLEDVAIYTRCAQGQQLPCPPLTACPALSDLVPYGPCASFLSGPCVQGGKCCYNIKNGDVPTCGRPFLVDGESVRAGVVARGDWREAGAAHAPGGPLDPAVQAALARGWLDDARMEHASIASFARLSLQMLALGAPPELVEEAQRASLDEIAHARACFSLARRYGGEDVGPGRLPLDGAVREATLVEAAVAAVHEGCVGETVAALQAAEQLASAEDEAVRAALSRIAQDEAAHAELAYRFVAWALSVGGAPVQAAVERAFAEASAPMVRGEELEAGMDAAELRRHGRLPPAERARLHRAALCEVIAPCARSLLSSGRTVDA
jgi:hypothetical protein